MADKIDKHGFCPNCSCNWDKGDVFEVISQLDAFSFKTYDSRVKIAGFYGWTVDNKIHFTSAIVHNVGNDTFIQCSNIRCGHVFNKDSGVEYVNLAAAKRDEPFIRKEDTVFKIDTEETAPFIPD